MVNLNRAFTRVTIYSRFPQQSFQPSRWLRRWPLRRQTLSLLDRKSSLMPPRHASQCRRVLQTPIIPTRDGVWISDGQLAAAFERYCDISRQVRRKASSVPGPLESRRRLGKRQIADLNAIHNTHSLPFWALPNAVDMSKWQWEPPTSASEREQRRQHPEQLGFLGWSSISWPSGVRE